MVVWRIVLLLSVLYQAGQVAGWAYVLEGDCPDNHQPGDSWFENCSRCDCHAGAYACYGCGVVSNTANHRCYLDYPYRNETYPRCCEVKEVCPGDGNFDHNKMAASHHQLVGR